MDNPGEYILVYIAVNTTSAFASTDFIFCPFLKFKNILYEILYSTFLKMVKPCVVRMAAYAGTGCPRTRNSASF